MNPPAASTSELYELLISLLSQCPQTIEILPGEDTLWVYTENPIEPKSPFSPFLFVEGNLGVPQKILYKLYLHAVHVFKSARSRVPTWPTTEVQRNPLDVDDSLGRVLVASSSILLLANPSHQTALNARKHLIPAGLIDPDAELRFTASLLSSQHCAKHAELWYHRRWLLSFDACNTKSSDAAGVESYCRLRFASQDALQQELELISRACEVYPRNYFAWAHRSICMQSLLSDYLAGVDAFDFVRIFCHEVERIKGWIDRHVSDYSAIHHVLALSQAAFQSGNPSLAQIVVKEDLLDHAISLVQEYPAYEALWMYIRFTISIPDLHHAQLIQHFIEHFVQPLVYLQHLESDSKEDAVSVSQFARWFLSSIDYKDSQS